MAIQWRNYPADTGFDEFVRPGGRLRDWVRPVARYLRQLSDADLDQRRLAAEQAIRTMGITFTVYSEQHGSIDREWPFDFVPRILPHTEWSRIEHGLKQRVQALNLFIDDIYHEQKIVRDGVFPAEVLAKSRNFRPECVGADPPFGVWAHICGSDLVRDRDGTVYVLEDNLRVPSGVSYMLENRAVMKRVFPEMFQRHSILPVDAYPSQLYDTLTALSPRRGNAPEVVVLTPGIYNSAYFEHAYLAQQMGAELLEGSDLVLGDDESVYMRTVEGLTRVDVIYRRVDDLFLDPEAFHPESVLGLPGMMRAWRKGNVALANAPGCGVADDKVVYSFVPEMIRYYLGEDEILPNVPTFRCMDRKERAHVLDNLDRMVVKPANESGGYGMLIGPQASRKERERFVRKIRSQPREYIAQPMLNLSTVPTVVDHRVEPRHVDLRPFILSGPEIVVTTGGLTRVALKAGSTVVNSSQGGGSKDTWVVSDEKE